MIKERLKALAIEFADLYKSTGLAGVGFTAGEPSIQLARYEFLAMFGEYETTPHGGGFNKIATTEDGVMFFALIPNEWKPADEGIIRQYKDSMGNRVVHMRQDEFFEKYKDMEYEISKHDEEYDMYSVDVDGMHVFCLKAF